MSTRYRGAIIGCGRMGAFTSETMLKHAPECWHPLNHAEAMRANPGVELVALCDINPRTLEAAGRAHGVERLFVDREAMMKEILPDILAIATRTIGRTELIESALSHGLRAIHSEKPLCNSVAELERLQSHLSRSDLFFTFGTIRRFFPLFVQARELAMSGRYGSIREVRVALGPGTLYWTHPHSLDLILFAAGERTLEGVQARLGEAVMEGDVLVSDPIVESATLYFSGGVTGHITRATGYSFTISCEAAEIIVSRDGARLSILTCPEGDIYPELVLYPSPRENDGPGGSFGAINQLASCLSGHQQAIAANSEIKRHIILGQKIAFSMVQSHREGSRILNYGDVDTGMKILARSGSGLYA